MSSQEYVELLKKPGHYLSCIFDHITWSFMSLMNSSKQLIRIKPSFAVSIKKGIPTERRTTARFEWVFKAAVHSFQFPR